MPPRKLKADVYWIGAVDWDRRIFDELIPLPDGTTYNSYLVTGSEKTALIDTVDPTMTDVLINNLNELDIKNIDYVVANHAEQDHSGSLPQILKQYPNSEVLATPQCKTLLQNLLLIPEDRITAVKERETLSLGDKTLEFIHAPWVHWPETMVTYLPEDNILFTCDLFGSHLATSDLYVTDEATIYDAAKRYYAEIMMPFRTIIHRNLKKIEDLEIEMIAPSHGPLYDRPESILQAYRDWVNSPPKNIVIVPYISMHGSTKKMVEHLVDALIQRGVTVKQFNLAKTDIGKLAMALVDGATIVVGSPTVLVGPHPNVIYAAYLTNILRPKLKFASVIGSYGWGSRMVERIKQIISDLKIELLDPVITKGAPKEEDFAALDKLADKILSKHKEYKLMD